MWKKSIFQISLLNFWQVFLYNASLWMLLKLNNAKRTLKEVCINCNISAKEFIPKDQ